MHIPKKQSCRYAIIKLIKFSDCSIFIFQPLIIYIIKKNLLRLTFDQHNKQISVECVKCQILMHFFYY